MASISEGDLLHRISVGNLSGIWLLHGEEKYQLRVFSERLFKKIVSSEDMLNRSVLDGTTSTAKEISELCMQLPVFATRRLVVVNDLPFGKIAENDLKIFEELFSDFPAETTLVFCQRTDETPFGSGSAKKMFTLLGKFGTMVNFIPKDIVWQSKYIADRFEKSGIKIEMKLAKDFAEITGGSLEQLSHEIEKLIAFKGSDGEITQNDIEELCTKSAEASTFQMARNLLEGKAAAVFNDLSVLFSEKTSPVMIISAMNSLYLDIFRMLCADAERKRDNDLCADFSAYKNKAFKLRGARKHVSRFTVARACEALKLITEADYSIKSSSADDQLIIEQLCARLIEMGKAER